MTKIPSAYLVSHFSFYIIDRAPILFWVTMCGPKNYVSGLHPSWDGQRDKQILVNRASRKGPSVDSVGKSLFALPLFLLLWVLITNLTFVIKFGALVVILDFKLNLRKETCSVWRSRKMGAGCLIPVVDWLLSQERKTNHFNVTWFSATYSCT